MRFELFFHLVALSRLCRFVDIRHLSIILFLLFRENALVFVSWERHALHPNEDTKRINYVFLLLGSASDLANQILSGETKPYMFQ